MAEVAKLQEYRSKHATDRSRRGKGRFAEARCALSLRPPLGRHNKMCRTVISREMERIQWIMTDVFEPDTFAL